MFQGDCAGDQTRGKAKESDHDRGDRDPRERAAGEEAGLEAERGAIFERGALVLPAIRLFVLERHVDGSVRLGQRDAQLPGADAQDVAGADPLAGRDETVDVDLLARRRFDVEAAVRHAERRLMERDRQALEREVVVRAAADEERLDVDVAVESDLLAGGAEPDLR